MSKDSKYNIIESDLDNEDIIQKFDMNGIKKSLLQEKLKRIEGDNKNSIKISEESVKRAKGDSKLSMRISKEKLERVEQHLELKTEVNKLENRVSELEKNQIDSDTIKNYINKETKRNIESITVLIDNRQKEIIGLKYSKAN